MTSRKDVLQNSGHFYNYIIKESELATVVMITFAIVYGPDNNYFSP